MRKKKAIYNVLTNLLLQIIYILYGFIVPKIIISKFGSNINGLVTSITQFLAYISLLESGFGPVVKAALYKPLAKKDSKTVNGILKTADKFFKTISMIFIAYIMVLCIFYPLMLLFYLMLLYFDKQLILQNHVCISSQIDLEAIQNQSHHNYYILQL